MNPTTRDHLQQALAGEAVAALKYWLFEEQAESEGLDDVAELFERIGKQERKEHAKEIARLLGLPGSTRENLRAAIDGEIREYRRLYPEFANDARTAGDTKVAASFVELATDEHWHAVELRRALDELPHARERSSEGERWMP
jgi:rubrerythrin